MIVLKHIYGRLNLHDLLGNGEIRFDIIMHLHPHLLNDIKAFLLGKSLLKFLGVFGVDEIIAIHGKLQDYLPDVLGTHNIIEALKHNELCSPHVSLGGVFILVIIDHTLVSLCR